MLAASSTNARELELFIENRLGGDSNVFRRADEQGNDPDLESKRGGVFEVSPRVTLRDDQDELQYEFRYQPTYERFFAVEDGADDNGISGLDHLASGDYRWNISPVSSVGATGRFSRQRRLREGFFDLGIVPDPPVEQTDNEYVQRGRGTFFASHAFSPRVSVQGSYTFDDLDSSQEEQADNRLHSGSGSARYALTRHTNVGLTATYRTRSTKAEFDPDPDRSGTPETDRRKSRSETRTVDIAFSIEQEVTPNLFVSVGAGPSFFDTRDEDSLGNVSNSTDDSVFASVSIERKFRRGNLDLSYTRSEGGSGGTTAATSILDSIAASFYYTPIRRWTISGQGGWTQRETISSDAFLGRDVRTDAVFAAGTVQRRFTENLSVLATIRYSWSRVDEFRPARVLSVFPPVVTRSITLQNTTEAVQGSIAIRYTFDPYVF